MYLVQQFLKKKYGEKAKIWFYEDKTIWEVATEEWERKFLYLLSKKRKKDHPEQRVILGKLWNELRNKETTNNK